MPSTRRQVNNEVKLSKDKKSDGGLPSKKTTALQAGTARKKKNVKNEECELQSSAIRKKRKSSEDMVSFPKRLKTDSKASIKEEQKIQDEEKIVLSPRRSGRGMIPNRKFQDMEVDYTPLKEKGKQSLQGSYSKVVPEKKIPQVKKGAEKIPKQRRSAVLKREAASSHNIKDTLQSQEDNINEFSMTTDVDQIKEERTDPIVSDIKSLEHNSSFNSHIDDSFTGTEATLDDNSAVVEEQVNSVSCDELRIGDESALLAIENSQHNDIMLSPETGMFIQASTGEVSQAGNDWTGTEDIKQGLNDVASAEGVDNVSKTVENIDSEISGENVDIPLESTLSQSCANEIADDTTQADGNTTTVDQTSTKLNTHNNVEDSEVNGQIKDKSNDQSDKEIVATMQSLIDNVDDGTVIELVELPEGDTSTVETTVDNLETLITPEGKQFVVKSDTKDSVLVIKKKSDLDHAENSEGITIIQLEKYPDQDSKQDRVLNAGGVQTHEMQTQTPTILPGFQKIITSTSMPKLKTISISTANSTSLNNAGTNSETERKEEYVIVQLPAGQTVKRHFIKEESENEVHVPFTIDEKGDHVCGVCSYRTSKKANWYKHKKKHSGQKLHKCPYCEYMSATSSNLKRHINIHKDLREHKCPNCSLSFRQKIHLERHIKYKHEEKQVQCPICDYMCANENPDLKIHIRRRHLPQDTADGTVHAFKCDYCDLMTINKKDLRQHMKFHKTGPELKLFCEYCSFVTDCESRLRRHMLTHTQERPFQCGLCEYRATQKEHVLRHMKSQHQIDVERRGRKHGDDTSDDSRDGINKQDKLDFSSQEKIFACNHCSMKFSKLLNLYKHLHTQHKDILPTESDEYMCVVCDFKTASKKNLLVHMRKHNMQDQLPPSHVYSCVLCKYINPKRRNLFQHMKKKHGIEIVMKNNGTTSCFVTDNPNSITSETIPNELNVGEINAEENQLQIITNDSSGSKESIISLEELARAMSHPKPFLSGGNLVIDEGRDEEEASNITTTVHENDAEEAIKGLQALAEQPGIVQNLKTEPIILPEAPEEECIKSEVSMETEVITMETTNEVTQESATGNEEEGIQLSPEQIMHLTSGDFVEINGEMYKVEISQSQTQGQSSEMTEEVDNEVEEMTTVENVIPCSSVVGEMMQHILNQDGSV